MNDLISVIVPVYNAQRTLASCIESILAQEYETFELLLINDGSSDDSGAICDRYAQTDPRIKVFHRKNGGAAAARNAGIRAAAGKYLMFCDSDDLVSPQWIRRLADCMTDEDTLPIGAAVSRLDQLGTPVKLPGMDESPMPVAQYVYFGQLGMGGYVTNQLFVRRVVEEHGIFMRERHASGDYNEDLIFSLEYAAHMQRIVFTGYGDYWYNQRPDSLSRSFPEHYFEKFAEKYTLWRNFLERHDDGAKQRHLKRLAGTSLYHFFVAIQQEVDRAFFGSMKLRYRRFRAMVLSESVQEWIAIADTSAENPLLIRMVRRKQAARLWLFYLARKLKLSITKG